MPKRRWSYVGLSRDAVKELVNARIAEHTAQAPEPTAPSSVPLSSESPYLTAAEAARYLRYASVRSLYDAIPTNNIPVCRRGGKTLLFDRRDLDRWLHGERIKPRGR